MRIALLFVSLLLHSCIENREDEILTNMKSPVVIIGKNPIDIRRTGTANITVKDSNGCGMYFSRNPYGNNIEY